MDFGAKAAKAQFWRWISLTQNLRNRYVFLEAEWDWRVGRHEQCGQRNPGLTHVGERVCDTCGIALRS